MSALLVEEHDDRVLLTLDRPEDRNAIDLELVGELHSRRKTGEGCSTW